MRPAGKFFQPFCRIQWRILVWLVSVCYFTCSTHASNVAGGRSDEKFLGGLLQTLGSLGSLVPAGLMTAPQSPEAMRETQVYAAIKAQQDVSRETKVLEDELVALQDEIRTIDKATIERRQEVTMRLMSKKLELLSAISRTAKILRAAYSMAYPDKADQPIVIVPRTPSDAETAKALKMHKIGLEEASQGLKTKCASVAQEFSAVQQERQKSSSEFVTQADALKTLPLNQRLAFDREKIYYWQEQAAEAKHQLEMDNMAMGIFPTEPPKKEGLLKKSAHLIGGAAQQLAPTLLGALAGPRTSAVA